MDYNLTISNPLSDVFHVLMLHTGRCLRNMITNILSSKNMLVTDLLGVVQVITDKEAERRGKQYDAVGRTYLFDLDYNPGDCPFTVDAGYYGNVSHFINHSVRIFLCTF